MLLHAFEKRTGALPQADIDIDIDIDIAKARFPDIEERMDRGLSLTRTAHALDQRLVIGFDNTTASASPAGSWSSSSRAPNRWLDRVCRSLDELPARRNSAVLRGFCAFDSTRSRPAVAGTVVLALDSRTGDVVRSLQHVLGARSSTAVAPLEQPRAPRERRHPGSSNHVK